MPEIITGFHFDSGSHEQIVDYGQTFAFTRPGGDRLSIAIVADSGLGQNRQAAQIAINTFMAVVQRSLESNISDLLTQGVYAAHRAIYSNKSLQPSDSPEI